IVYTKIVVMSQFLVEPLAVAKIVLHACKYPHTAVNGVLLAEKPSPDSSNSSSKPIVICNTVPLFHSNLNLAPMLEAALMQIEATYKNYAIVGYYQANELLNDASPDGVGAHIYQKIAENCPLPRSLYILVDNKAIDRKCSTIPLIYYQRKEAGQSQKLERLPNSAVAIDGEEDCLETLANLLVRQAYRSLVDFDNHLDDIGLDWTNSRLAEQIRN
ncbi:hypothetical protein BOX15_Mlig025060g1, partial [Macrostomum lignano]